MDDLDLNELSRRLQVAEAKQHTAEATEIMLIYLRRDPSNIRVALAFSENLRVLGRPADAEKFLKSISPDAIPSGRRYLYYLNLANIYDDRGDLREAEKAFLAAIEATPNSTIPWVFCGTFLAKSGRLQDAISALTQGLNAVGDLDEVHLNLGNCYRALGDYALAEFHFRSALKISPDYDLAEAALSDVMAASSVRIEFSHLAN